MVNTDEDSNLHIFLNRITIKFKKKSKNTYFKVIEHKKNICANYIFTILSTNITTQSNCKYKSVNEFLLYLEVYRIYYKFYKIL